MGVFVLAGICRAGEEKLEKCDGIYSRLERRGSRD